MGFFKDTFWPSREVKLTQDIESLTRKIEGTKKQIEGAKHNLELVSSGKRLSASELERRKEKIKQSQTAMTYDKKQLASLKDQLKKIK